jgi:hypothetical protein
MNQESILINLCKHKKLIGEIFNSRMLIQPMSNFSEIEQEILTKLINETKMIKQDSDGNIWLNPSLEMALEEMLDIDENINLGKISNYLENIKKSFSLYSNSRKELYLNSIVKNFNNIILALEDNSRLVSRKKGIGFGGAFSLKEKMHYLEILKTDIVALKKQTRVVDKFISIYKRKFRTLDYQPLLSKLYEVGITRDLVSSSLSHELRDILETLKRITREDREQKSFIRKLRAVEYLYEHGRLESETDIKSIVLNISDVVKLGLEKQLNSKYIDSEEYADKILEFSKELGVKKKIEKKQRINATPSTRKRKVIKKNYIDADEVYALFIKSKNDVSLLKFIESIESISEDDRDEVIDIYLEIIDIYHSELAINRCKEFEDTKDSRFSVLNIKRKMVV